MVGLSADAARLEVFDRMEYVGKSGRRKIDAETDQEEKKELAGSLAEKKLPTDGCTGGIVNCPKTDLNLTCNTKKAPLMRQLGQEIMGYVGQFLFPSIAYIAD
ncbi:hypothetical protein ANN_10654 [Periplaneta americana]|uniref:Uncharacterized protein n=1 Tax=Periplaneta americana TaxID=6978 RepID=A0ABQ8T4C9_PERAM|nr:hypothetical protein ANN_10654 [Periplaneta americana]